MSPTRLFPSFLSRPNFWAMSARLSPRGAAAIRASRKSGSASSPSSMEKPSARPKSRPTARAFWDAAKAFRTPIAMIDGRKLSNTVGAVLDPIFALRRRVRIAPGAVARISFWTMAASTRETLLDIIDKHRDATAYSRATTLAWTQAQVQLHHLGVTAGEASLFQRLASHVIYANPTLRPPSETILRGAGAQSGLWALGVSGDLPIVLLRISDANDLDIARELLQAHEYWRMKRLAVDLVILNERQSSYVQDLQIALETLIRTRQMRPKTPRRGFSRRRFRAARRPHSHRDVRPACFGRAGRPCGAARRAVRSDRTDRRDASVDKAVRQPAGEVCRRAESDACRGARGKTGIFQRARRLRQGRPGICDNSRPWPGDACSLDQCRRQRKFRLPGGDRRQRLHLVCQQPREPAHALVERPGRRSPRRGLLPARRRHRRIMEPDGAAHPHRGGDLSRPPWSRLQPFRAHQPRRRVGARCNSCRSTPRSKFRG